MLKQSPETVLIEQVFDPIYYEWEYPDIGLSGVSALQHFLEIGWKEGRNPNAFFDTAGYLLTNSDVADERINPYYHYLRYGLYEGRETMPAASPSVRTRLLFGYEVLDWIERITPDFDRAYYAQQCREPDLDGINPVAHFAYYGWRRGLSPSRSFPLRRWLTQNPALARFLVNPVIIQGEKDGGRFDDSAIRRNFSLEAARHVMRAPLPEPPLPVTEGEADITAAAEIFEPSAEDVARLKAAFSPQHYLAVYDDVAEAGTDPFAHYLGQGWRENRNPNAAFDAAYYAATNPDVVAAGINPFLHYLLVGQSEGRLARAPGGYRRAIIEAAVTPEERSHDYVDAFNDPVLQPDQILAALRARAAGYAGLAVACSHDCYVRSVGGMQIFITDEEAAFRQRGYLYVQVSPRAAKLHVLADDAAFQVRLVCDAR